mmetsp:Transcript_10760/g.29699  ORF Transcript_10760/g.29699 Transcript_10760/m.29699 type:complete len:291 (-) Transcript_10760:37-909(-)
MRDGPHGDTLEEVVIILVGFADLIVLIVLVVVPEGLVMNLLGLGLRLLLRLLGLRPLVLRFSLVRLDLLVLDDVTGSDELRDGIDIQGVLAPLYHLSQKCGGQQRLSVFLQGRGNNLGMLQVILESHQGELVTSALGSCCRSLLCTGAAEELISKRIVRILHSLALHLLALVQRHVGLHLRFDLQHLEGQLPLLLLGLLGLLLGRQGLSLLLELLLLLPLLLLLHLEGQIDLLLVILVRKPKALLENVIVDIPFVVAAVVPVVTHLCVPSVQSTVLYEHDSEGGALLVLI